MSETPDLRVGVLAARTFRITDGYFTPLNEKYGNDTWATGVAVAKCLTWIHFAGEWAWQVPSAIPPHPDEDIPARGCVCGLYSFTSAQEVARQYGEYAHSVLAVIAPEGRALEGEFGWRAEKATILAAWVVRRDQREALEANYPHVRFYSHLADLLTDYPAIDNGGVGAYNRNLTAHNTHWTSVNGVSVQLGTTTTALNQRTRRDGRRR